MENYEKKYKEALERAKELHGTVVAGRDFLAEIFPELTESEDERIREELIKAFEVYDIESSWNLIPVKHILAWLEKQKEQKSSISCGHENDTEWSEEDEKMRNELITILNGGKVTSGTYLSEYAAWLKSLRPQPKVEWSKEDEENFKWFDKLFRAESMVIGGRDIPQDKYLWFKLLRPSWKPSEDEERLIKTSISFLKDFADKGYENAVECIDWLKSKLNGNACK